MIGGLALKEQWSRRLTDWTNNSGPHSTACTCSKTVTFLHLIRASSRTRQDRGSPPSRWDGSPAARESSRPREARSALCSPPIPLQPGSTRADREYVLRLETGAKETDAS